MIMRLTCRNCFHRCGILRHQEVPAAREQEVQSQSTAQDGLDRAKAEEAFALVNQQRSENGLELLPGMIHYTILHVPEPRKSFRPFTHKTRWYRHKYQYPCLGFSGTGENIARYGNSASDAVNSWMNSEGHRRNILDADWVYSAMACYRCNGKYYWVNLFGM